tara:strand:- start:7317 stop:10568 length:3252 start_codon:yes stop_codon:yes gene_type:complete
MDFFFTNIKIAGTSRRILLVNYDTTQAVVDQVDRAFPHQTPLVEQTEFDNTENGSNSFFTTNSSDLLRYHLRKYYRDFPKELSKKEGITWPVPYGYGAEFFNPGLISDGPVQKEVIYGEGYAEVGVEWISLIPEHPRDFPGNEWDNPVDLGEWTTAWSTKPDVPDPGTIIISKQGHYAPGSYNENYVYVPEPLEELRKNRDYAPFWSFLARGVFTKKGEPHKKRQFMTIFYNSPVDFNPQYSHFVEHDEAPANFGGHRWIDANAGNDPIGINSRADGDAISFGNEMGANTWVTTASGKQYKTSILPREWAWRYFISGIPPENVEGDTIRINSLNLKSNAGPFYDFAFDYAMPVPSKDIAESNIIKPLQADFREEYNFLMESYEDALGDININLEPLIPNMNILMDIEKSNLSMGQVQTDIKKLITLNGINGPYKNAPKQLKYLTSNTAAKGKIDFDSYLDNWSNALKKNKDDFIKFFTATNFESKILKLFNKSKNIVIPPGKHGDLAEYSKKKHLFPMYAEINFDVEPENDFANALHETGLWSSLVAHIVGVNQGMDVVGLKEENIAFKGYPTSDIILGTTESPGMIQETNPLSISEMENFQTKIFDLDDWMEKVSNGFSKPLSLEGESVKYITLDARKKLETESDSAYDYDTFLKKIMQIAFKSKYNKLIEKHSRTYADILAGEKSYSETVVYRVAKIDSFTQENIQNFYFINNGEVDTFKYIDTQVEYDKEYEYKVYSWKLIVGTEYEYKVLTDSIRRAADHKAGGSEEAAEWAEGPGGYGSMPPWWSYWETKLSAKESEFSAAIAIDYKTVVKLVEVPYAFSSPISIMDDPPMPPNVSLVPYKNKSDRVLITLSSQTGEMTEMPIAFSLFERNRIEKLRKAKNYSPDGEILFKTDDHIHSFEIFRISNKPTSYEDFIGSQIARLEDITTFVDDTIKPNRKYYYMFRAMDEHAHVSNPTVVYEFEMVKNLKASYPIITTIDMEKVKLEKYMLGKKSKKILKKYLHLRPSKNQIDINYDGSEDLLEIAETASELDPLLGFEDESLIGKKFKIRLTSRKTGRRLDFNIDFKKSYDDKTKIKIT